jgi:acetyl esterase/lipase
LHSIQDSISGASRTRPGTLFALLLLSLLAHPALAEPEAIRLWSQGAPGSEGQNSPEIVRINEYGEHIVSNVHFPSITPYLPAPNGSTRAAVVVVPGGGHRELWMDHEGYSVARYLAAHGVAAFVLKYRLAREERSPYTVEGSELPDLQRAIRLVRSRVAEWQVDPDRIGVMGFSAGGELAALSGTHHDRGAPGSSDPVEHSSSRPAFVALLYPSIPKAMQPTADTPPMFMLCGADDQPAISQGVADLYLALRRVGVSAELHIYAGVGHGFGLRANNQGPVAAWPQQFLQWLGALGLTERQ